MAVTETLRALGSWGLTFTDKMPDELWKKIDYFGHIAIVPGRRPAPLDDSLLRTARYVGPVIRISDNSANTRTIGGVGMATWLGDPEGKGDVFLTAITVDGDFDDVIRDLLPAGGAVTEGTIFNTGETFGPSTFQYQTPRELIDYVCETLGGHAWRVNGDGTLDAGLESDLFVVSPKCVVARKNFAKTVAGFDDMFLRGLAGLAQTERDVEDYSNHIALLAQGINGQFVSAEEELDPGEIPFVDIHGNKVKRTRIIQESDTDATNAPARAQLQLNRFKGTRDALTLSTSDYDIKGKAQVGDYLWVYDPAMDLVDNNNEVIFRGQRINPFKLRLTETTWPVTNRMSVLYRAGTGEWLDLSKYFAAETGDTTLVVGGYNRSLIEGGTGTFPITQSPDSDTTVPGIVVWDLPWTQSQYQSPLTGETKSEVEMKWLKPDNTDSSTFTDAAYYEIRYRQSATPLTIFTLAELDALSDDISDLNTVESPIILSAEQEWQYDRAPGEVLKFRLQELTPGMTYEAQVRAVDTARPPHLGDWSLLEQWQASRDLLPPATPAAPMVAANPMAVQIIHQLGRADGGTFNLDRDLGHLEVHAGTEPLFNIDGDSLIGKIPADWGMILGQVPVVASFQITQLVAMYFRVVAVDVSGNKSLPSAAVVATAELISDQYISNLTASKITAGTITSQVLISGRISTAPFGTSPRVEMTGNGLMGRTPEGVNALLWDALTGRLHVNGRGGIEIKDGALTIKNGAGQIIVEVGECLDGRHGIQVYKDNGVRVARIGELESSGDEGIEVISDLGAMVRVDTLAFGIKAASVSAFETTASAAFTNLATFGPSVTVTLGTSQRCIVIVSGTLLADLDGLNAFMGFEYSGPGGTNPADEFRSLTLFSSNFTGIAASKAFLASPIAPPGNWTFTARYKVSGGTAQFGNRHIIAIPY